MCGRFTLVRPEQIASTFHLKEAVNLEPRYNIAPSQSIPIITLRIDGKRHLSMARWGMVPSWAKDEKVGHQMINARSESVEEKPAFRAAYKMRRCLIPADGFFEWKGEGKLKQPYYIRMKTKGVFGFAGLWEHWKGEDGQEVVFATILTTSSNSLISKLHDRMPVIIPPEKYEHWLESNPERIETKILFKPYDPYKMTIYPVSTMVNSPKNDGPGCVVRMVE